MLCILYLICLCVHLIVKQGCRIDERAQQLGCGKFPDSRICSNTIRSHRLVQWVCHILGWKKSEELFYILTTGHFIEGKNLNNTEYLVSCAEQIGLQPKAVREFLDSKEYYDNVKGVIQQLLDSGLNHIPVFIINNQYVVDGAGTSAEFMKYFRMVEEEFVQLDLVTGELVMQANMNNMNSNITKTASISRMSNSSSPVCVL